MTPEQEKRKKRLELIKQKYKKGVPKLVIDEVADKCAKEIVKEIYCNKDKCKVY